MMRIAVMFFAVVTAFSVFAEEAAAPAPVNNRAEVKELAKRVG